MSTTRPVSTHELSTAYVHKIFRNLESGDGKGFFDHVADDVDWIVEGTHPLAGHYHSKAEFLVHTFEKLAKVPATRAIAKQADRRFEKPITCSIFIFGEGVWVRRGIAPLP